jgi:hypothetical protein
MKQLILLLFAISLNAKYHKHIHKERYYQIQASKELHGQMEYKIKGVRVDIITSKYAIEVDFAKKQYEAIGQALYYSILTKKKPAIVLIVENYKIDLKYILRCKAVCRKYDIRLWIIDKKGIKLIH